ncbi:hypothetical protein [Chitinophaga sp. HK235]|uniref:hypothetical protein n=1 Tax=Chitinophaga sp. HK235 TaxID=2952571 RepID=UPI001BA68847|nr:hypothetical protein [Chitinophaga sp. HK235]
MKKVKLLSDVAVVALCGAFAAAQADINAKVWVGDPLHPERTNCSISVNATLAPNGSPFTTTFATLDRSAECPDIFTLYTTI